VNDPTEHADLPPGVHPPSINPASYRQLYCLTRIHEVDPQALNKHERKRLDWLTGAWYAALIEIEWELGAVLQGDEAEWRRANPEWRRADPRRDTP